MKLRTLRGRVVAISVAILSGWIALLVLLLNLALVARLSDQANTTLRTRAEAAAVTLQIDSLGNLSIPNSGDDETLDASTWIFQEHRLLESPPVGKSRHATAATLADRGERFLDTGEGPTATRWYAQPIYHEGAQVGTVVTSISLAPYQNTEQSVLIATMTLGILLMAAAYFTLRVGTTRSLRPVAEMSSQAAEWSESGSYLRFGESNRPMELQELADRLDALLERNAALLRHEKALGGEISHELRTPLARILAEAELLHADPSPSAAAIDEALTAIESSAADTTEIIETILATARGATLANSARCEAGVVLRELIAKGPKVGPIVTLHALTEVFVAMDRVVLIRATSPVLENARRYGVAAVSIKVFHKSGSRAIIEISDDGAGIAEADLENIFMPGFRSESGGTHPGAGLGLALARRILTTANGTIQANNTPLGACFTITLPVG